MHYRADVVVRLKDGVLDPQGQTILQSARSLGFRNLQGIRVGKQFALDLEAGSPAGAQAQLERLCQKLLANPVIETYAIKLSTPKSLRGPGKR